MTSKGDFQLIEYVTDLPLQCGLQCGPFKQYGESSFQILIKLKHILTNIQQSTMKSTKYTLKLENQGSANVFCKESHKYF